MICIITFFIVFDIWILSELSFFLVYAQHMRTATFIFRSFNQSVISFARFSALMLSSFIDVSLCSVDAAHMHSRDLFDQMSIFLWSRLMLLTYASHRLRSFFNPTSSLECAGHLQFLKFNPTSRIFPTPAQLFQPLDQLHPSHDQMSLLQVFKTLLLNVSDV